MNIESILKDINKRVEKINGTTAPDANLINLDYRTSAITGMKITCNITLFGINAGESLNNHFVIGYFADNQYCIISSNKLLIASNAKQIIGMGLNNYIDYKPYAPSMLYLKFKSLPQEALVDVSFSIEMEVDGAKTINGTSKAITLRSN